MEQRPMTEVEQKYTYSQSRQISGQCGLIGYLRADMGRSGTEFWSTWNGFRDDLKTDKFRGEIDDVINELRDKGFLQNRRALEQYYQNNSDARFDGEFARDMEYFGVRVDTDNYSYLMRLTPRQGEYNMYCYCYRKDWLDSHIERAGRGIRFINPYYQELFRIKDGGTIVRRERVSGKADKFTCRYIDDYHVEINKNIYHICEWAEICTRNGYTCEPVRESLPLQCYSTIPSSGELVLIKRNEQGYYPCPKINSVNPDVNREFANEANAKMGVTKAQEEAMLAGSMFGWHTSAADPNNYDDKGNPVKPKHKDRDSR